MLVFNAFVNIPEIANNTVGQIAKFGELSVPAQTYTKEIRNYADVKAYPGIELVTLSILDNNERTLPVVNEKVPNKALSIANFLYTQYTNKRIPLATALPNLIKAVNNEFSDIRRVEIGEIINGEKTGERWIDFIRYDFVVDNEEWRTTLWFSDEKFRQQYPLFNIVVIPPVGDILRLNDKPATVAEALTSVGVEYTVNRIADITRNYKATTYSVYTTKWHDPNGTKATLDTKWTVVIYGQQGIDQDMIKDAIREYLSNHGTGVEWATIFPDLYSENEFILIPYWGQLATPTEGYDDGLYSSITGLNTIRDKNASIVPKSYGTGVIRDKHLNDNFELLGTTYRGINIGIIGNPNNRGNVHRFSQQFPDYMSIATDRSDFTRMTDKTQRFVLKLLDVLELCRDFKTGTVLPTDYSRAIKANREYIGFGFEGYDYYVLTRIGYNKEF